jgi:hypothetical protein
VRFRRPRKERHPHPDPATELQLRQVLALVSMRDSAAAQVAAYQRAVKATHDADAEVIKCGSLSTFNAGHVPAAQVIAVLDANLARRREAEEAIREQRALAMSLGDQVTLAADGLTPFDLAYLAIALPEITQ